MSSLIRGVTSLIWGSGNESEFEQLLKELEEYEANDVSICYENSSGMMNTIYPESRLTFFYYQEIKQFHLIFDCTISQDGYQGEKK